MCLVFIISIHAPTKGATPVCLIHRKVITYFNPRSHEGSDLKQGKQLKHIRNFNPRSHEGSDNKPSIKGMPIMNFNPRSHEGSDLTEVINYAVEKKFQSTLPRRERRKPMHRKVQCKNFNPRSHEGSDRGRPLPGVCRNNFNPRSHEGSDGCRIEDCIHSADFNPRSHEGSDEDAPADVPENAPISIHAPTKGATSR